MNILELKKQIQLFLKTKADRVYFRKANEKTAFPYVVFNFPDSDADFFEREDIILEVDIWDKSNITTTIDTLTGSIDGDGDIKSPTGLNRKSINIDSHLRAKIYRINRYTIDDEEKKIERRQLRYKVKAYLLS